MAIDAGKGARDEVDRAILDALRRRAEPGVSSSPAVFSAPEDDEALISTVVAAHLEALQRDRARKSTVSWIAATGLLAAAAVATLWLLPGSDDASREATTASRADTRAATQAMWVWEDRGTPLEGVAAATDRAACGKRDGARACLAPGSRGAFGPDGSLELLEGTASVEAQGAIAVSLADVDVQVTTEAATFSATHRASVWTVVVESGTVTVTGFDGAPRVLAAGESAGSEPAEVASVEQPVDVPDPSEPAGEPKSGDSQKPTPSADALLELARSQRAARNFDAAARTYEQLIRTHPSSAKVRATLVSLAQLYQGPLDDPARALRHFDRYLERGGPLAEEAHYGKIRALRSLGRADAAKTEVDAFLRAYPDSAHADALRGQ